MELGGDEKRIRALFSELSVENQITAPRFEKLWQGAVAQRPAQSRGFSALIAAAVVVVIAVFSFVVWSQYRSIESVPPQNAINVTPQTSPTTVVPRERAPVQIATLYSSVRSHPHRVKKLARQPKRERSVATELPLLSSWVSPTATFLESPAGSMFNSLPQLNQSAEDLKTFLPKNNER